MHYLFFEALARFHPCFMTLVRLCPNFFGFAFMGHVFAAGQAMVIQSKVGYYCLPWWSRRILEVLDNILFLRNPQQVLTIVIFSTRKGLTSFFFFSCLSLHIDTRRPPKPCLRLGRRLRLPFHPLARSSPRSWKT